MLTILNDIIVKGVAIFYEKYFFGPKDKNAKTTKQKQNTLYIKILLRPTN